MQYVFPRENACIGPSSRRRAPARRRLKRIPDEGTHRAALLLSLAKPSFRRACGKIKREVARKFRKPRSLPRNTRAFPRAFATTVKV